jgi:hypothetical protein
VPGLLHFVDKDGTFFFYIKKELKWNLLPGVLMGFVGDAQHFYV